MSVRNALLALLEQGPRYGYQLRAEFEDRTGGTWPLNVGQVYTTLSRLERDGLIEGRGEDGDGHVVYAVTSTGREEVAAWFSSPVPHVIVTGTCSGSERPPATRETKRAIRS